MIGPKPYNYKEAQTKIDMYDVKSKNGVELISFIEKKSPSKTMNIPDDEVKLNSTEVMVEIDTKVIKN